MLYIVPFLKLIETLVAVLASSLRLLATLNAGALIMLSATDLSQNTGLGAAALKTLQSAIQRFIFLNVDFRHLFSLPPMYPAISRILFRANYMA